MTRFIAMLLAAVSGLAAGVAVDRLSATPTRLPEWAALTPVSALTADVAPHSPLSGISSLDAVLPITRAEGSGAAVTAAGIPDFARVADVPPAVDQALPVATRIAGTGAVKGDDLPKSARLAVMGGQEADPFLTWSDVWCDGVLGQLQKAARQAAATGDEAECRRLVAAYWAGLAAATARRQALEVRGQAGKQRRLMPADGRAP